MREILQLERAVENLRCTRDLLLPRLLSGQVALSEQAINNYMNQSGILFADENIVS